MINNYVITHLHTALGSIGDSTITNKSLIKKLKELGMNTVAMTDHGSLSNMYSFYYDCIKEGIKPIIGCEVYLVDNRLSKDTKYDYKHLILIAKNNTGIKNLIKIVSDSMLEGFYYKPRTDLEYIKQYSEGLICTTACVNGYAPSLILDNKIDEAKKHILELKDIFKDDLYLEIQPGHFEEQYTVNQTLIMFHEELNIKLIATNDVHYIDKDDWLIHEAHIKSIRDNEFTKADTLLDEDNITYPDKIYYMMTYNEFLNNFDEDKYNRKTIIDAIKNTNRLANKCNIEFNETNLNIPMFNCPNGFTPSQYLEYLCFVKLEKIKYKISNPYKYVSRIKYELDIIEKLNFSSYFLIIRDIVLTAKKKNISVGPGRGSATGSLVGYLIGLTKIDPIKYNLMFERFLSIHRKGSLPDIDTDFGEGRDEIFKYTTDKYGKNKCVSVSTFGYRKSKGAIRAAGRVLGIDLNIINDICSYIKKDYYLEDDVDKDTEFTIYESLEREPKLREFQVQFPTLFEIASKLEGLPSSKGVHAAGIIISNKDIIDTAPLTKSKKDNPFLNTTALDLHSCETQMLVKYDFLKLNTLDVIKECEKITGDKFDIEFNNFDDENVWNLIGSKSLTGLFQIGSSLYKDRMYKIKPKSIEELANCIALIRGPCLSNKLDKKYIDIINYNEEVEYIHPLYDEATKDTYGIMIYQEQLMKCCFNMGMELYEGYKLMKASSKKNFDEINKYKKQLWNLVKDKMNESTFNYIFKLIHDSGKYSFNKSHAISYATLCYETAYYKYYHTKEFIACSLTNIYINKNPSMKENLDSYIKECRTSNIVFLPLDIKKSRWEFTVEDNKIRIGFCALKNFSKKAYEEIQEKCVPFNNDKPIIEQIYDNVVASICGKTQILALIFSNALGDIKENFKYYFELRKEEALNKYKVGKTYISTRTSKKKLEEALYETSYIYVPCETIPSIDLNNIKYGQEFNTLGYIDKIKKHIDKNNHEMAFLNVEIGDDDYDFVMFSETYDKYKEELSKNDRIMITAKKNKSNSDKYRDSLIILDMKKA